MVYVNRVRSKFKANVTVGNGIPVKAAHITTKRMRGNTIQINGRTYNVANKINIPANSTIKYPDGSKQQTTTLGYLICEHMGGGFWDCSYVW